MYGFQIPVKPDEKCPRCNAIYEGFKTFVSFIDPSYQRQCVTVYGSECCHSCAQSIVAWGADTPRDLVTTYGLSILKLHSVHLCLVSWQSWPPLSYQSYGIKKRVSLSQLINKR